jgi:diacylglycerol kinase family enzyme
MKTPRISIPSRLWRWLLAGVALGLLLSGWFWRGKARSLMRPKVAPTRVRVKQPALIINRWSGDGRAQEVGLADAARQRGVKVIMLERDDDLTQLAHDAISAGADAVGMAGGDGSLGLVAGVAIERGVPFFCIPVGTRNHFALDLGLDRSDPLAALAALDAGDELEVDYVRVNGRVFLNNLSLGIYATAVHEKGYRESKTETIARVTREAADSSDTHPKLRFDTPDGKHHDRTPMILVSNNPYLFTGPPDFGRRRRLDAGQLGVTAITSLSGTLDLAAEFVAELPNHHQWETGSFRVESDEAIQAGVDGEALTFTSPLTTEIKPRGLSVLVPEGTEPGYVPLTEAIVTHIRDFLHLSGEGEDPRAP